MLVFLSDLHLTDGTTCPTLHPGAIHHLGGQLREIATRASWRAGGHYQPIDRIDLVLLGDILDLTTSARWLRGSERPWTDPSGAATLARLGEVVDATLQYNAASLGLLRSLAADSIIQVPPADRAGNPAYDADRVGVSVRTFYMVGNRDWMLHLPGQAMDMLRQRITHHMGLANGAHQPFPHDPCESSELQETLRRHRVLARHGDVFDPLSYADDRDTASLSDLVVIELLTRFLNTVRGEMGGDLPENVLKGLAEIHQLRPAVLAPVWIEGLMVREGVRPTVRKKVRRLWDATAEDLLSLREVREMDAWSPHDLAGGLERSLLFRRGSGAGWAETSRRWNETLRGADSPSYAAHALAEPEFRNRRATHVVYGHTHASEAVPLEASYADGFTLQQMYFNAGTWRRVYRATQVASAGPEFIAAETMQLLAFYEGDQRAGRSFETVQGMVAPAPTGAASPAEPASAPEEPAAAPAERIVPSPHFAATTADVVAR